jgi:transglutaminase-like putative cysteine protease
MMMKQFIRLLFVLVASSLLTTHAASAIEPSGASLAFTSRDDIVLQASQLFDAGKFSQAEKLLASNTNGASADSLRARAEAMEIIRRTRLEYSLDAEGLLAKVRKSVPAATARDVERWAKESKARFREIDGARYYFRREPQNIFLFSEDAIQRPAQAGNAPKAKWNLVAHLQAIVNEAERTEKMEVQPVHHQVTHTLTIRTNAPGIKAGALVRVWLPYAQEYRQQRDLKLISVSPEPTVIAPNGVEGNPVGGAPQRTIYFEQRITDPSKPIEFKLVFDYNAFAYYPKLDEAKVQPLPADWNGASLGERLPHIAFTPEIRKQVTDIVGTETNSLAKARKIFRWVSANVAWNAEDEYCIIPSLAIKGFTARRGDCGVQNTVFVTMCRIAGIPARWQSGFETKPEELSMHDWAEIYIAPWGWLPADASYGVQNSKDPRIADFYCGHQDSYRLIVNLDWGRELFPPKPTLRSEPADLQRGEVEVDGQNLYFDQWDLQTDVETKPSNPG